MNVSASPTALTVEQKRALYRDGYVVVPNAVAPELVDAALARIRRAKKGESLSGEREMTDLVNASSVTPVLHEVMGRFDPPTHCQIGVNKRSEPGDHFNNLGYRDRDMPYYGAQTHMDGLITIAAPQEVQEGTPEEIYHRYFASGPKGDLGRSPDVMGHNMVPMFQDPEMTLGNGSFTAFVFVCLNDQSVEGCGQTALLRGAHHAVERFFRGQYAANGHLGPEGPRWPRLNHDAPNRCGLVYLPDEVREQFLDETSEVHARRPPLAASDPDPDASRRRVHHELPHSAFGDAERARYRVAQEHHLPHPQQAPPAGQGGQRRLRPSRPRPDGRVARIRGRQRSVGALEARAVQHVARVGRDGGDRRRGARQGGSRLTP